MEVILASIALVVAFIALGISVYVAINTNM